MSEDAHLGVRPDPLVALLAGVGEEIIVALDAVRMIVAEDVALARQRIITIPAAEVAAVPILIHGFCKLAAEYQLKRTKWRDIVVYCTLKEFEFSADYIPLKQT